MAFGFSFLKFIYRVYSFYDAKKKIKSHLFKSHCYSTGSTCMFLAFLAQSARVVTYRGFQFFTPDGTGVSPRDILASACHVHLPRWARHSNLAQFCGKLVGNSAK